MVFKIYNRANRVTSLLKDVFFGSLYLRMVPVIRLTINPRV